MYDDIINLKRPEMKHKRQNIIDRASQFSPFSALNGFEDSTFEAGRIVDNKILLEEEQKEILNYKLLYIKDNPNALVEVVYFIRDLKKDGGEYKSIYGTINKIDDVKHIIKINNIYINIDDILDIRGDIFNKISTFV